MQRLRRRVRDWPRPTRRGGVLLVAGAVIVVAALAFDLRDLLLPGFVAIAVPLVALGAIGLWRPELGVVRRFEPAVAPAGTASTVLLTVRNLGARVVDGAVWTDEAPAGHYPPEESVLPAIGPYERILRSGDDTARLAYRLHLPRRGVHLVGPVRVHTTDPFGLARAGRAYGPAREIVVTPRVTPLGPGGAGSASIDGGLHSLMRRTHPNSDELTAREYRHGDPYRRVHWRATARRGELMVRQEEQRGDPEAVLVLDTGLAGRLRSSEEVELDGTVLRHGFELGVELAASIGVRLLEEGFRLRFGETSDPRESPSESGGFLLFPALGGESPFLEHLARIDRPAEPRHPRARAAGEERDAMPGFAPAAGRRRPLYVVLVDPDEAVAEALVAAGGAFAPCVAFVLDSVRPSIVERLETEDWRCPRVRRPSDLAQEWSSLAEAARRAGGDAN